ncbi:M15 family metallopeptidase [Paenibacillus motobuensis]|uniref:M15 family metallopeptidase n=1 Tax=Paenibacillus motobuensis TaxID=295324 RepID=UPI00363EFE2C
MTLTLEYVQSKSAAKLNGLLPAVRAATEALITRCFYRGVPIVITQGLRTIAEQDALYAQGRTQLELNNAGLSHVIAQPGKSKVTNARGGYSNHNFGVAIDFALLLPDGKNVSWDMKRDGNGDRQADWAEVVEEAKKLGFAWGGDWVSFKDTPHFEMTFGLTTAQYRAGKRPTQAQIDAAFKKINETEGDNAMTPDEKAAFAALKKQVAALEKNAKMATIPTWAAVACENAKKAGLLDTTADGSYDFYRMVTIMDRAGLFKKGA